MKNAVTVARQVRRNALALPDRRDEQLRAMYEVTEDRKVLRQISDFSLSYEKKKFKGIFLAFALICYSAICLMLFIFDLNVMTLFSVGALVILIQLLQCGFEFFEEGMRMQRAYHAYLNGFSPHVLFHLRRAEKLSAWSQYEIDRYIESIS